MKTLLTTIAILLLLVAPQTQSHARQDDITSLKTADIVAEATTWLKRGRNFTRSIALLEEANKREPGNRQYQTYLACAYASRAYTLCVYVRDRRAFPRLQDLYEKQKSVWSVAQQKTQHLLLNMPFPPALVAPRVQDDKQVPKETDIYLLQKAKVLADKSLDLLSELVAHPGAAKKTVYDRNEVTLLNTQGWTALLLCVAPYQLTQKEEPFQKSLDIMKRTLQSALAMDKSIAQKSTVGDAYVVSAKYLLSYTETNRYDKDVLRAGIQTLTEIAPKTANPGATWYWIADSSSYLMQTDVRSNLQVQEALRKALNYDPTNALYNYSYAASLALGTDLRVSPTVADPNLSNTILRCIHNATQSNSGVLPPNYKVTAPVYVRWVLTSNLPSPLVNTFVGLALYGERETMEAARAKNFGKVASLLNDMVRCGIQFYRSSAMSDVADQQRYVFANMGWQILYSVGMDVAHAKIESHNRELCKELEFTWEFLPEQRRKFMQRKLDANFL